MKREHLLQPGQYIALPKSLAADTRLNAAAKLVWAALADRLGSNETTWPGEKTIAKDTGIGEATAGRAVAELQRTGWLSVATRPGKSNSYILSLSGESDQNESTQNDPTTQINLIRHPDQNDPTTRINLISELLNTTTEGTTEPNHRSRAASPPAGFAGSPSGVASSPSVTSGGQDQGSTAYGTSAKSSKATVTTRVKKPRAGVGRARPAGLTDEQKRSVCSSTLNMMAYLVHGSDAIGKPMDDWRELEPGAMHWAPAGRDLRSPEPGVGVPALAAYYWVQVCRARLKVNVPMALPDVGKLTATVKTLRGRMTHEDLVQLIDDVTKRWVDVASALSWMSSPPQLDELTLHNRHVLDAAKRLASGQSIQKPAPVVGVGVSEETEKLIKERYANLF